MSADSVGHEPTAAELDAVERGPSVSGGTGSSLPVPPSCLSAPAEASKEPRFPSRPTRRFRQRALQENATQLEGFRFVATRYEKRACINLGTVTLTALAIRPRTRSEKRCPGATPGRHREAVQDAFEAEAEGEVRVGRRVVVRVVGDRLERARGQQLGRLRIALGGDEARQGSAAGPFGLPVGLIPFRGTLARLGWNGLGPPVRPVRVPAPCLGSSAATGIPPHHLARQRGQLRQCRMPRDVPPGQ